MLMLCRACAGSCAQWQKTDLHLSSWVPAMCITRLGPPEAVGVVAVAQLLLQRADARLQRPHQGCPAAGRLLCRLYLRQRRALHMAVPSAAAQLHGMADEEPKLAVANSPLWISLSRNSCVYSVGSVPCIAICQ